MKRSLCFLLSLALLLGAFGVSFAEDAAAAQTNGFVLKNVTRFEMVGADILLYEHEKTGAQVMFILNDDLNRVFDITFRTPCLTDKGVAHVLEHTVLGGSAKYPSKSLFFNLSYQTYNTYMNASTYNFMTSYPVASLSEEQLLLYADFYTDSVFHPMVLEDESLFREEAWRYTLADAESELGIEGTVYSEMQGAYTINRAASLNYSKTLFPGATDGRDSGGIPKVIYTMTWDDVKDFYRAYYHPSNSLTCIYGKIENVEGFLALLDAYFSEYEKKEFNIVEETYEPITEPQNAVYQYGLAADADTANGAVVYYGFVCEGADEEDQLRLDFLTTLINDDTSVFQQRMKDELPSASAACYVDSTTPEYSVYFYATGVNEEDAPVFKQIVDESVADVIENGFDADAIDAIAAATVLDILLTNESSEVGIDLIPTIAYYWASMDDLYYYMDYIDKLDLFVDYAMSGVLSEAAATYLTGNERTALVTTVPVAGLADEEDAAFAEMLAEVKAGMSEEEIAQILATSEEEEETAEEAAESANYVAQLTAVSIDSLPEETRVFDISDTVDENGIRHIAVDANTNGVGQVALLLDAQGLEQEQLHYFKLFVDLLGSLDTASHTRQQLAALQNRYLYNGVIKVSVMDEGDSFHPYMRCTFIALDDDLEAGYDLIYELLYETDLSNAQAVLNNVSNLKNNLKRSITNSCYAVILYRAQAASDPTSEYYNYMTYLEYYDFLSAVEAQLSSDPEPVLEGLRSVQQYFFNRSGAVAGFVGSAESAEKNAEIADAFLMKLDDTELTRKEYDLGEHYASEALIVDGSVMYNMYYATWEEMGLEGYNGAMDAVASYVLDTFLLPLLRDQYGAYGVFHSAGEDGVYIISYRDPNVLESFEVYNSLPALIDAAQPDQETLNGYISSAYSAYATSNGELTDGFNALLNYINGDDMAAAENAMRELKSLTPESFRTIAAMYQALCENPVYATAGSATVIKGLDGVYENVLNPFGVKSADEIVLSDLGEDTWCLEAVQACMGQGLIFAESDTQFGVDSPATLGDLATMMYILIGGDNSPDDAIAYLAPYGVFPQDPADTVLNREQMLLYTAYFCYAMGLPVEEAAPEGYADADQLKEGDDGFIGWILRYEPIPLTDNMIEPAKDATRGELCSMFYTMFIAE